MQPVSNFKFPLTTMSRIYSIPNLLTFLRIAIIPLFVISYYLPYSEANILATAFFVLAALTDWLDGYLARVLDQSSPFGAFLDPVADKLLVATALVLLVSDIRHGDFLLGRRIFSLTVLIIIGREITISALRERMAGLGKRSSVAVSYIGKYKTLAQMFAISFLLFHEPLMGVSLFVIGEILLYASAALTLWSMADYLNAAWKDLISEK